MPSARVKGCVQGGLIAAAVCALGALVVAVCVVAFYLEEDLRGAEVLRQAQRNIEAHGVSLDSAAYYPTLPDAAENFGALPLFQVEPDPHPPFPGSMKAAALAQALKLLVDHLSYKNDDTGRPNLLPYLDKWTQGPPNLPLLRARLADLCRSAHPEVPPTPEASVSQLLGQLCPALGELRAANASRPLCVFPRDYQLSTMHDFSFGPETTFLSLAKGLAYEERIALYDHQPQLALDDMAVGHKVILGLQKEPFLLSGLIAVAIAEMQGAAVQQGLADHAWSDAQLAQLDAGLGTFDFLSSARFWMEGDVVAYDRPAWDYVEKHCWQAKDWVLEELRNEVPGEESPPTFLEKLSFALTPKGWFDRDRAGYDSFKLLGIVALIDPAAHRVHPESQVAMDRSVAGKRSWLCWSQPLASDSKLVPNTAKTFAFEQVHVDEARIAGRLERYRLAHGVYPSSLEALVPAYGGALPRDVMNGEPYRYRLRPDGSYLLYSVGWNQLDDQGDGTIPPNQSLRDASDWVWPNSREPRQAGVH
jgi:hypothetical protein